MHRKHIVLGVTGSIAAYKAVDLVRQIKIKSWDVSVIMTEAATEFVGELTFRTLSQNPVAINMFDKIEQWEPDHIALADRADALLIAPCTANTIAKMAQGIADNTLTCTALACKAPIIIAPAMNEKMWAHPATQLNIETLSKRGVKVMDVGTGDLACGYQGKGKLAAVKDIMSCLIETVE